MINPNNRTYQLAGQTFVNGTAGNWVPQGSQQQPQTQPMSNQPQLSQPLVNTPLVNPNVRSQDVMPNQGLNSRNEMAGNNQKFVTSMPVSTTSVPVGSTINNNAMPAQQGNSMPAPQVPAPQVPAYGLGGAMDTYQNTINAGVGALTEAQQGALGALAGTRQDVLNQQTFGNNVINMANQYGLNQIGSGVQQGLDMLNQASGLANINANRALGQLRNTQSAVSGAYGGAMGAVSGAISNAMGRASSAISRARGEGFGRLDKAGEQLEESIATGRADVTSGRDDALQTLDMRFGDARNQLEGFGAGGVEAGELQARLSGALGADAQREAMASIIDSPEFEFMREQGLREINANASAMGGTMGGELLRDLTRFGQGLASQRFDTAYNRLTGLTDRGLNVAGMRSNIDMAQAGQEAQAIQNASQQLSALQQALGSNQVNLGRAGASLAGQLGSAEASVLGSLGSSQASALGSLGASRANAIANLGSQGANVFNQLSGLQANLAGQGAGMATRGGEMLANLANSSAGTQADMAQNVSGLLSNLGGQASNTFLSSGDSIANLIGQVGLNQATSQQRAGELLAQQLQQQGNAQAGLQDNQGTNMSNQLGTYIQNLATMINNAGQNQANDNINLAQLLAGIVTGNVASGQQAILTGGLNAGQAYADGQQAIGQGLAGLIGGVGGLPSVQNFFSRNGDNATGLESLANAGVNIPSYNL